MHLLILIAFTAGLLAWLWLIQAIALLAVGERKVLILPFHHGNSSPVVRWSLKLALQAGLLSILLVYPWTIGEDPLGYHLSWLGSPHWGLVLRTMGLTVAVFAVHQAINVLAGWVRLKQKYSVKTTAFKVLRSFLTPVPLAIMEEALFRGVVLEQMLQTFPQARAGAALAIVLSAAVFASVHFIRPQKRTFLPALGLFGLGVMLGVAYVVGGRNCWLPVAIHAGGVWVIQVLRPFVEYRGPAWVTGYPSYPICGLLGFAAMLILTVLVTVSAGV